MLHSDIKEVLFTKEQIDKRVGEIADELNKHYSNDETLYCIGLLKGSGMFMMDLVRKLTMPVVFDFMVVSSYGGYTVSSGNVNVLYDVRIPIENKNILIIEDIIDTGNTLTKIKELFVAQKPASIKIATFLNKQQRRKQPLNADYVGYDIPDEFVVGYGLDYNEKYRNLPYIGVLKESVWGKS